MKVSDFKFAEHFIRRTLKHYQSPFVDVDVEFRSADAASPQLLFEGNKIIVNNSQSLSQTLHSIITIYLSHTLNFTKECSIDHNTLMQIMNASAAQIRAMVYSDQSLPESDTSKPIVSKLSQYPFVWIMMRDVVCPTYECPLKNIEVLRAKSPKVDVAKILNNDEVPVEGVSKPFIFLNSEVESNVFKTAFLLREAIKAHSSEYGICPDYVIQQLLTSEEIKDVVKGYVDMAFVKTEDVNDFVLSLCAISNIQDTSFLLPDPNGNAEGKVWFKGSSRMDGTPLVEGNWWMMGLYESMLEGMHGPRTDEVSQSLEPFLKDLWERVAQEKKIRGKTDMSIEDLLRVQSQEFRAKKGLTLQGLLADQRIW